MRAMLCCCRPLFGALFLATISLKTLAANASLEESSSTFSRWKDRLTENSRIALDVSTRPIYYSQGNDWGTQNVVGLDIFKVLAGRDGDFGTVVAQAYYTRIDNVRGHPAFFDDDHDGELVYRIFNFNFSGLPGRAPNIRLGHMEIAYGLEHTLDTNGTLRQFGLPGNLGLKADWGVSLNQQHRHFEYEVSLTTGGGQSVERQDGSFVLSARVGSNRDENFVVGASVYRSELGGLIRERFGLDVQRYHGRMGIVAELSTGNNDGQTVLNGVVELSHRSKRDSWRAYLLSNYFSTELDSGRTETLTAGLGLAYTPDQRFSLSAQFNRTMSSPAGTHPSSLSLQARYRL